MSVELWTDAAQLDNWSIIAWVIKVDGQLLEADASAAFNLIQEPGVDRVERDALRAGLRRIHRLLGEGCRPVCRTDSRNLVAYTIKAAKGEYGEAFDRHAPLGHSICSLARVLKARIEWVPRRHNVQANSLVNKVKKRIRNGNTRQAQKERMSRLHWAQAATAGR